MSSNGLIVCLAVLSALELQREHDHEAERDAGRVGAEQVADHQPLRVRKQQHHRHRREQRRVEHREQRQQEDVQQLVAHGCVPRPRGRAAAARLGRPAGFSRPSRPALPRAQPSVPWRRRRRPGRPTSYGAGECCVDGVGVSAVIDRDDAGRARRQRGSHLLLQTALDPVRTWPSGPRTTVAGLTMCVGARVPA